MQQRSNNNIRATVEELEDVLMKEKESLLTSSADNLEELTRMKNVLLETLGELTSQGGHNYGGETLESINRCYLLNRENAQLVNHRLKITRQSLGLIRKHADSSEVLLYDPDGKVKQKVASINNVKV